MNIKRGGIYLASLDPAIGSEISKTRPVVVVSNDINNQYSATVTVLPVTSKNLKKTYPFEVLLTKGTGNLPRNSRVKADQIRTLDKSRLVAQWGMLEIKQIKEIDTAMKVHLALR